MANTEIEQNGPLVFRASLYPHRSLGRAGFVVLMTAISFVSFVSGLVFYLMGAWPVTGFFGLDVALIYLAFKLNYRAAQAYETVEVWPSLLKLTRVDARGNAQGHDFNPYWVRVLLNEAPDGRTDMRLASHGRELPFGRFLSDDERREFSIALSSALAKARTSHGFAG